MYSGEKKKHTHKRTEQILSHRDERDPGVDCSGKALEVGGYAGMLLKSDFSPTMSNLLNAPSDIGPDTERPVGVKGTFLEGFFIFTKAYATTLLIG